MKIIQNRRVMTAVSLILVFCVVQFLISIGVINAFRQVTLAMICINIVLAVSLNLVTGFTGQFSLGHAGFMSIGAYTCSIIMLKTGNIAGFITGIFAGAFLAALAGILIGVPTLRLRGDYLAIATLGMAEIIRIVFLNLQATNGAAGLAGIPRMLNWPWMFLFTALTLLCISNFINSSHGRACISIREDEIAAESMGVNTTKYKVMAFAIGALFAGIAGAMHASYFYFIKPDNFGFLKSIDILVIVVLGGMGSISGSIIAAVLLTIVSIQLQPFGAVRMIIYAALLVVIMIFRPQGIMGSKELSFTKLIEKIMKKSRKGDRIE